jgi:hypothetical protein
LAHTQHYDVVVLGASREGLLQQVVHGNIPEAIARGVNSTVILVRGAPLGVRDRKLRVARCNIASVYIVIIIFSPLPPSPSPSPPLPHSTLRMST